MGDMSVNSVKKPRYAFIDILRILACFLVIVNHTIPMVFLEVGPSSTWFVSMAYFYISKVSVPVFVMIAGYTMLDKQDDYKKSMQRVVRMIAALFLFSFPYYLLQCFVGDRVVYGVMDYISAVLQNPLTIAFWYLHMYIGLMLMLPFVQKLVSNLTKKDCQIFIGITIFICGTMPMVEHLFPNAAYSKLVDLAVFDSYISMLLIGYYIKKYIVPTKKLTIIAGMCYVTCIVFSVGMTLHEYYRNGGVDYLFYDDRVFLANVLEAACFFYLVQQITLKEKTAKIVKVIAGCTFGIYLISDMVYGLTQSIYRVLCSLGVHAIVSMVVFQVAVFIMSFVLAFIMKKIPVLRKLL